MNHLRRTGKATTSETSSFTIQQGALMAVIFAVLAVTLQAQPTWWTATGGPLNSNPANDYVLANQGQLKQFTQKAVLYMDSNLAGGAGSTLDGIVAGWSNYYVTNGYSSTNPAPADLKIVNQGQLKYIGNLVWSRLVAEGYTNAAPSWIGVNTNNDYIAANLGQLKTVFNFDFTADSDGNGLPDWWEMQYFGQIGNNATSAGPDGNGFTLLQDYAGGADPLNYYSQPSTNGPIAIVPGLAVHSGNNQIVSASAFATNALVVQLTNSVGGGILTNAPVTFSIASDSDGGLAMTNGGSTFSSLNVTTDTNGYATVYYQAGTEVIKKNTIAATTSYSSTGSVSGTFTEACGLQSGLVLWLKSDAGVNPQVNNHIDTWADQSPMTNNAGQSDENSKPTWVPNALNSYPVVNFNKSNYLKIADNSSLRPSSGITMLAVCRQTDSSTYEKLICKPYANSNWNPPYATYKLDLAGSTANYADISFTFDISGGQTGVGVGAPAPIPVGQTTLYSGRYTGTQGKFSVNGVLSASATMATGTLDYGDGSSKDVFIGMRSDYPGASTSASGEWFQGDVAEILIYDHSLTDTEEGQIEGYLADRYGLYNPTATWPLGYSSAVQTYITANQLSKAQADAYVAQKQANLPIPVDGLGLWLKSDAGLGTSGSTVVSWTDQSIYHNDVGSYGSPQLVTNAINQLPGISLSGGRTVNGGQPFLSRQGYTGLATGNKDRTLYYVAKYDNNFGNYEGGISYGQGATYQDSLVGVDPNGYPFMGVYNDGRSLGSTSIVNGTYHIQEQMLATNGVVYGYINGTPVGSGSGLNFSTPVAGYLDIGVDLNWSSAQQTMCEVIAYNRALTDAERLQVETYLGQKYALPLYGVGAPTISPTPTGTYTSPQTISISTSATNGIIYYTKDGSTPTTNSLAYSSSFSLTNSALVQAMVFNTNQGVAGLVASAQYYINDSGSTGLPPPPNGLTITANPAGGEIDLAWVLDSAMTFSGINVYRSVDGGGYEFIAALGASATTYADTSVTTGHTYAYKIGTVNGSGISGSTNSTPIYPTAPTLQSVIVTTPTNAVPAP